MLVKDFKEILKNFSDDTEVILELGSTDDYGRYDPICTNPKIAKGMFAWNKRFDKEKETMIIFNCDCPKGYEELS